MAVAPAAEEIGGLGALAINFLLLCFCIVAFGMIRFSSLIVQMVQFVIEHTVGGIPLLGSLVHDITDPVFAAVERGFADAALGVQGAIGFYWHALATLVTWLGREIRHQADLIEALARVMLTTDWAALIARELGKIHDAVRAVEHAGTSALHRVVHLEHTIVVRAQAAVLPRVHGLEDTIGHVVLPDLAGLRERTRELLDRLDATWKQVRKLDKLLATAAFTSLVAVAVAQLGMGWTRCRNWKRIGKGVCGLPYNLIDDLLGLSLAFAAVVDPVALAEAALAVEDGIDGVISLVAE